MSVVLATVDDYSSIETTLINLSHQTIRNRLEVVVVCPDPTVLGNPPSQLTCFHCHQIVSPGPLRSIGHANACGVRHSRARIVALAEDHAFMEPEWAESLLQSHQDGHVAVAPVVKNGNPNSWVSRADFAIGYGPWEAPRRSGLCSYLPGHNCSYKKEALLALGSELERFLNAETLLHWRFRDQGYTMYLDSRAVIHHMNFSVLEVWFKVLFHNGRNFAGLRRRSMSWVKRCVYVIAGCLIPLVRFVRLFRAASNPARIFREAPGLLVGLAVDALGQIVGYALGPGTSGRFLKQYEFRRIDFVNQNDRALFAGHTPVKR